MADPCSTFWARVYQSQIRDPRLSRHDAIRKVKDADPQLHQQMLDQTTARSAAMRSLPRHQRELLETYTFDGSSSQSSADRARLRAAAALESIRGESLR